MNITIQEQNILIELVKKIISSDEELSDITKSSLIEKIAKRMEILKLESLSQYLLKINQNILEYNNFNLTLSNLNGLTPSGWHESLNVIEEFEKKFKVNKLSSTKTHFDFLTFENNFGQFSYSIALFLENYFVSKPGFSFTLTIVFNSDQKLKFCKRRLFPTSDLTEIPNIFKKYILIGSGPYEGFFVIDKIITKKIKYFKKNNEKINLDKYDYIFDKSDTLSKLNLSSKKSDPKIPIRTSDFVIPTQKLRGKIMVIEDVPVFQLQLVTTLSKLGFEITTAGSAEEASQKIKIKKFDLITLDFGLPGVSGAEWLKKFRTIDQVTPVVVISSSDAEEIRNVLEMLQGGAQHFFIKDEFNQNKGEFVLLVEELVRQKYHKNQVSNEFNLKRNDNIYKFKPEVILIGASTGGPQALIELLSNFPKPTPPVLFVQHTSPLFISQFTKVLSAKSGLKLGSMGDYEKLNSNTIYGALNDYHIEIQKTENGLVLVKNKTNPVHGHRPSVDVLFKSAAEARILCLSILLTGMGKDGAVGMKQLSLNNGNYNIAQSAKSSVVFGMPKAAIDLGVVNEVGDLKQIRKTIEFFISLPDKSK